MFTLGHRLVAAVAIVGSALLFMGVAVTLSNADEPRATELNELRDAINAAAKRGENVDEIRKAFDALQKSLGNGFTAPEPGKTSEPSPELAALRDTVEAAARKGENVEEIRKQLETVEKALTGKILAKPKPLPPVDPPVDPPFNPKVRPQPFPMMPGNGIDPQAIQKAQEMTRKASEMLLKNPDDPEAKKLLAEAKEMMLKALLAKRPAAVGQPPMIVPDFFGGRDFNGGRMGGDRFRLGVRMERVSELAADQLGLEVARGVGIVDVVEGSAAQKAGFKQYDIVLEFAGKPVSDNPDDFTRLVASIKAGEKVDAVVMRKGKKVELKGIVLPEQAQAFPQPLPFDFQPFPDLDQGFKPGRQVDGPGKVGNSIAVSVTNGQVVVKAQQDGVMYVIHGERKEDMIEPSKIIVTDAGKITEVEKLDKVPEKYRGTVEELLKSLKNRKAIRP